MRNKVREKKKKNFRYLLQACGTCYTRIARATGVARETHAARATRVARATRA